MKYAEFLRIAAGLNTELGVTPLLFGSLGLERRLNADLQADDIDVLLPELFLRERWAELTAFMERAGYRLYDPHEHAFERAGVSAAFASLENLRPFAGIDITAIPALCDGGARYLLLTLEDYLRVYTASAQDGYRKRVKHKQDELKIALIQRALDARTV